MIKRGLVMGGCFEKNCSFRPEDVYKRQHSLHRKIDPNKFFCRSFFCCLVFTAKQKTGKIFSFQKDISIHYVCCIRFS